MCFSHIWLWDPIDYSPPGSSVHGIFHVHGMEWVAMPSSRGSSQPREQTHIFCVSCIGGWILYHWATWEAHVWSILWGLPRFLNLNRDIFICDCQWFQKRTLAECSNTEFMETQCSPVFMAPPQKIPSQLVQVSKEGFLDHSSQRVFWNVLNALGYFRTLHYFLTTSLTIFDTASLDSK